MRRSDFILALGGAAALVAAAASFSAAQTTFHPPPLKQFLEKMVGCLCRYRTKGWDLEAS
jgi:Spy/CpxP family protein refolding chaperone